MSKMPQYNNPDTNRTNTVDDARDLKDSMNYISTLISSLATDVGNLVTLQLDLLKIELRESTRVIARDSILVVAGAVLALFALGGLTAALIAFIAVWLPMSTVAAVATSALIVGVLYATVAGVLVYLGLQHLKKKGLTPERSIQEVQKDKELVKDIR